MEKQEQATMGKRIAALRKIKGFTQEQLAEKVGVSAQAVSKWENDISSPDISAIPLLAATLGVSTDELLGTKPVEPRVVVVDPEGKTKQEGEFVVNVSKGKLDAVVNGLLIIAFAVLYMIGMDTFLKDVSFWNLLWPVAIILCGVSWTLHWISPLSVAVIGLGGFFFARNAGWVAGFEWNYVWPILLVLVGLSIITGILFKSYRFRWNKNKNCRSTFTDAEGYVRADSSFSGEKRQMVSEVFRGGDIDVSFGSMELDLTGCKSFAEDCVLKVDVSFGNLELFLPRSVQLVRGVDNSFAACNVHGAPDADATAKLYLKGDVSFGSIEVRYR
ncbi:MAG: helix-turn-helix domain-containing protein [Clostridiales bacterium]|nr:helix-turn-helix domain-containing protein [Clostridiales bacterium]